MSTLRRGDHDRAHVPRASDPEGARGLDQGGAGGEDVVDEQTAAPGHRGPPSRRHLHRALEVGRALTGVEARLVGHPPAQGQRGRDPHPAPRGAAQGQGCVDEEPQRSVAAPPDGRGCGRHRDHQQGFVAGRPGGRPGAGRTVRPRPVPRRAAARGRRPGRGGPRPCTPRALPAPARRTASSPGPPAALAGRAPAPPRAAHPRRPCGGHGRRSPGTTPPRPGRSPRTTPAGPAPRRRPLPATTAGDEAAGPVDRTPVAVHGPDPPGHRPGVATARRADCGRGASSPARPVDGGFPAGFPPIYAICGTGRPARRHDGGRHDRPPTRTR